MEKMTTAMIGSFALDLEGSTSHSGSTHRAPNGLDKFANKYDLPAIDKY